MRGSNRCFVPFRGRIGIPFNGRIISAIVCGLGGILAAIPFDHSIAEEPKPRVELATATLLSGTKPLGWPEEDLSQRLMDGAHQFVERKISESARDRARYWNYDSSSPAAYDKSVSGNRERLREIIGAVDPRLPARMERFGDDAAP